MCAKIKIRGQDNLLEVSNDLAKEIKRIVLDNSVPRTTPIDLKVMMVDKGAVSAVFLDGEQPKDKLNAYDFTDEWRQQVLDFEREFESFEGNFDEFMIYKLAEKIVAGKRIITNLPVYEDLNRKMSALNFLRFLRKRAKENEAKELGTLEIDVSKINF